MHSKFCQIGAICGLCFASHTQLSEADNPCKTDTGKQRARNEARQEPLLKNAKEKAVQPSLHRKQRLHFRRFGCGMPAGTQTRSKWLCNHNSLNVTAVTTTNKKVCNNWRHSGLQNVPFGNVKRYVSHCDMGRFASLNDTFHDAKKDKQQHKNGTAWQKTQPARQQTQPYPPAKAGDTPDRPPQAAIFFALRRSAFSKTLKKESTSFINANKPYAVKNR